VIADGLTVASGLDGRVVAPDGSCLVDATGAEGLERLKDPSHRPGGCPHQMPARVEAELWELRRTRPYRAGAHRSISSPRRAWVRWRRLRAYRAFAGIALRHVSRLSAMHRL
jgi:hypothetical protein